MRWTARTSSSAIGAVPMSAPASAVAAEFAVSTRMARTSCSWIGAVPMSAAGSAVSAGADVGRRLRGLPATAELVHQDAALPTNVAPRRARNASRARGRRLLAGGEGAEAKLRQPSESDRACYSAALTQGSVR